MPNRRLALSFATIALLAMPAFAADGGQFVVRLGRDTTGVEQWERTPDRLIVNQVGRAPRVLRRSFTYNYTGGALMHLSGVVTAPGSETPVQTIEVSIGSDSLRLQIKTPQGQQSVAIVVPPWGRTLADDHAELEATTDPTNDELAEMIPATPRV